MNKSKQKAFTLIELLVVISIIGLLAALILVSLGTARSKAKDASAKGSAHSMQLYAALYYQNNGNTYTGLWSDATMSNYTTQLINTLDGQGARGFGAGGEFYYGAILLKDGNYMCFDPNTLEEASAVGWAYPSGPNYKCP